jgi:transketolase
MLSINSTNIKIWSKLGQRGTLGLALTDLGKTKEDLIVMSADLAITSGLDRFIKNYPDKFINAGIAEQNMINMAAGLSRDYTVFATTFATFASMRSYEQIRLNLGYMKHNVKIIGIGSGLSMGMFGNTHYGIEDLSLMRSVPGLTVLSPADGLSLVKFIDMAYESKDPMYIRLTGTINNPIVYDKDTEFKIGKANILKQGNDVAIIATGSMVYESIKAASYLEKKNISAAIIDMSTIKPLDYNIIKMICNELRYVVTVEEHSIIGGLGSAVAEFKSTLRHHTKQIFIGIPDKFEKAGSYKHLLLKYELTGEQIAEKIFEEIDKEKNRWRFTYGE